MMYARMFVLQGDLTTAFANAIKEIEKECDSITAIQVVPLVIPNKLQPAIVVTLWVVGTTKEVKS